MGEFKIPRKKCSEFPERRTISITRKMSLKMQVLDQKGVDVPQLIRDAIGDFLERDEIKKLLEGECQN